MNEVSVAKKSHEINGMGPETSTAHPCHNNRFSFQIIFRVKG
jgi:hypothetical protein